jgi:hypothetical protein
LPPSSAGCAACEHELQRPFRVVQQCREPVRIAEEQIRAFLRGKRRAKPIVSACG